jgi:hypothetical protein
MPYCQVHQRVFLAALDAWFACPEPQVSRTFSGLPRHEAACPECLEVARHTLRRHFPQLYTSGP